MEDPADGNFVSGNDVFRGILDKGKQLAKKTMTWYWISLSYATFGVAVDDETFKVVQTAPITKWMMGEDISYVQGWIKNKRGIWKELGRV